MNAPASPDPILLSTSPKPSDSPPRSTTPPLPAEVAVHGKPTFFIEISKPPSFERDLYEPVPDSFNDGVSFGRDDLKAIAGEWREGRALYYYVRFSDGLAHKLPAAAFKAQYEDLVNEYERNKLEGSLEAFDPSSSTVHKDSRIKHIVTINGHSVTSKTFTGSIPQLSDSELSPLTETDDSDDENDDDFSEPTYRLPTTRSTKALKQSKLPFSPRKLRRPLRSSQTVSDSEDELGGYSDVEMVPTRPSTRARKAARLNLNDDFDNETMSTDDEEGSDRRFAKLDATKKPKKRRPVPSHPAYGHFRDINDLDFDPYDDEDTASLRAHREVCEKCHEGPAHELLRAAMKPKRGRHRRNSDADLEENEEEQIRHLGGWVRCLKCPVAAHWRCLASTQRDEITRAAHSRDKERKDHEHIQDISAANGLPDRKELGIDQTTEFICGACMKGGICMGCGEVALEPRQHIGDPIAPKESSPSAQLVVDVTAEVEKPIDSNHATASGALKPSRELLFRCVSCKRLAHYQHLPDPDNDEPSYSDAERAEHYQSNNDWQCADCASFVYPLDKILAWRFFPPDATEPKSVDYTPDIKASLPREYLVKWSERSYRRVQWVPHMWLVSTHFAKLKNFLASGPKVELLEDPVMTSGDTETDKTTFEPGIVTAPKVQRRTKLDHFAPQPLKDAELRIPPVWKTVDRVLDVQLWHPPAAMEMRRRQRQYIATSDDDDTVTMPKGLQLQWERAFNDGEQPDNALLESVDEWETRTKRKLDKEDINQVVWAFIKWEDLGYEEVTWDSPPRPGEPGYSAFERAFVSFLESRTISVLKSPKEMQRLDNRRRDGYASHVIDSTTEEQPKLGQSDQLKLMKFQIDGLNWLCDNWWIRQPCILADEMGLGKTVQIVTFLGRLVGEFKAAPALVVVPNSTITNWVREFSRWAPRLRVVPFYGEAKSRDVVIQYELFHGSTKRGAANPKYHVLITTYETVTSNRDFAVVFRNIPRWEVLVVDEGQRLKSDTSLLFRKLNELNVVHRVIMTGTPLNNNIRELFNLMNFLDPNQWNDLETLAKEYEVLNEDLVRQLHARLKPYFLRRIKSDVLQLPPKNEVIVPVSMSPLQKEVYRSILSQNLQILSNLVRSSSAAVQHGRSLSIKANLNNLLMQLRKCLQHPYLISDTIEPAGLPLAEAHERLISASAKLRLLKCLLPKLKARGHRVLLFSQFVLVLDIVEDFLTGEGYKFLRLDGDTKQSVRQKGMDEFNQPDSDVFIYILTTRAGGVGINLYTADTVIIFDPDFNPHQDLQAISRSHRYGQQKTCLVFKLMVKDSAEEKIMQAGKKKLVLDHLIVQKMDDDENGAGDLESILTFGAKELFEENDQNARDIVYTDNDLDKLIEKTEVEGEQEEVTKDGGLKFSFAKVWAANKGTFEDIGNETPEPHDDSWAQTLQRIAVAKNTSQVHEATGRGVRRKAAASFPQQRLDHIEGLEDSPQASKKRWKKDRSSKPGTSSDSDAWAASNHAEDSDSSVVSMNAEPDPSMKRKRREIHGLTTGVQTIQRDVGQKCGLCDSVHAGTCTMTENSINLVEYRAMLLHSNDEPAETRNAAIEAIDQELQRRGQWHLIVGQMPRPTKTTAKKKTTQKWASNPPLAVSSSHTLGGLSSQPRKFPPVAVPPSAPATDVRAPVPRLQPPLFASKPSTLIPYQNKQGKGADRFQMLSNSHPDSSTLPSKRERSPHAEVGMVPKKPKPATSVRCVVCRGPYHLVKDCPVVAEGPTSIARQIVRLSEDPTHGHTVSVLRHLLEKQRR
ncbi:SNF2 family DNA-dependent ATPase [Pisolithus orientalis]|uniref:SNF2 family DNA-dependent ATPase n=1 Tax=Pisolithus orientalis TaxID=936130 RepID=UPI00222460E3|nr:SNF2 family DNA-dependent ATPase [Pisolithus orientalis]KAI6008336.1 SNF2 family DNA-dependent ATPase [Pisolithus orientalis]